MDDLTSLLDQLEPYRYDVLELRDRLDRLPSLPEEDQGDERFSITECLHPLQGLIAESHNDVLVVRDIGGDLAVLCEHADGSYESGRLCREHVSESLLEGVQDGDDDLAPGQTPLLLAIVEALPSAGGPVRRY